MECYSSKTCFVNHAQRHSNFKILRRERISQQTPFVPHCFTFYCLRYTSATGKGERKWETFSTNNVLFVLQWSNTLQRPPRGLITLQRPPRGLITLQRPPRGLITLHWPPRGFIYYTGHQGSQSHYTGLHISQRKPMVYFFPYFINTKFSLHMI